MELREPAYVSLSSMGREMPVCHMNMQSAPLHVSPPGLGVPLFCGASLTQAPFCEDSLRLAEEKSSQPGRGLNPQAAPFDPQAAVFTPFDCYSKTGWQEHSECLKLPSPEAPTKGLPKRQSRCRGQLKLAECLEEIDHVDPERVLRLTRLGRLGTGAERLVREYFADHFGPVERLLLVNPPTLQEKHKPSNMVFIVMGEVQDAKRALEHGELHEILPGVGGILVRGFKRKCLDESLVPSELGVDAQPCQNESLFSFPAGS